MRLLLFSSLLLLTVFSQSIDEDGFFDDDDLGDFPAKSQVIQWYEQNIYGKYTCDQNCSTVSAKAWGSLPNFCSSQNRNVSNTLCTVSARFSFSYADCKAKHFFKEEEAEDKEWYVAAPGNCGCPSDCLASAGHGTCTPSGCACNAGYTGADCSLIDCKSQRCGGRSSGCSNKAGFAACSCHNGYALGDCSSKLTNLPAVPSLLGVQQYDMEYDNYGNDHPIFNDTTIAQIHIDLAPADLEFLALPTNMRERTYMHANFSFYNGAVTEHLPDVGIRIKGATSAEFAKKSWKVSFNHFVKGREWAQQKKISLKGACMDSLFLREMASADAIYAMGAPAPRASHALVFMNKQLWGVYLIQEDPASSQYLKSRFGESGGSLWKCTGPLKYISDKPSDYRGDDYKAMNSHAEKDYSPLETLISILNLTPQDQFEEKIQTIFDVEFFLRTYAAEVATGNYDGIYNANNYFLYYKTNGLFSYYRFDLDLSFGFGDFALNMGTRNVWEWTTSFPPGRGYLLPTRILSVPSFQETFNQYLSKLMTYQNPSLSGPFMKRLTGRKAEIDPAVKVDRWHEIDFGMFTYDDFSSNIFNDLKRPNMLPPNPLPVFKKDPAVLWQAMATWIKERNALSTQQLKDGPPSKEE